MKRKCKTVKMDGTWKLSYSSSSTPLRGFLALEGSSVVSATPEVSSLTATSSLQAKSLFLGDEVLLSSETFASNYMKTTTKKGEIGLRNSNLYAIDLLSQLTSDILS